MTQEVTRDLAALAMPAATKLKTAGQTIAVAESSTAGLISACLVAVAGASRYYRGGSVIYTLESRRELLGIRRADVAGLDPMTEAMVERFASKAREQLDATWGIAELGIAGPTPAGSYGVPAGRSVIAVSCAVSCAAACGGKTLTTSVDTGHNNREENMWAFTAAAFQLLDQALR